MSAFLIGRTFTIKYMECSTLAMCEVAEIGSVLDFPDQGFSPVSALCQLPPVEIYNLAITR